MGDKTYTDSIGVWYPLRAASDPTGVTEGAIYYNVVSKQLKYFNGTVWLVMDTGDITGVTAGNALSGGGSSGDVTLDVVESDIDHANLAGAGTNTHAQLDTHVADATIHFTESSIDHTNIQNVGSNTHADIDLHLASSANPHGVTLQQSTTAGNSTTDDIVLLGASKLDFSGAAGDAVILLKPATQFRVNDGTNDLLLVDATQLDISGMTATLRTFKLYSDVNGDASLLFDRGTIGAFENSWMLTTPSSGGGPLVSMNVLSTITDGIGLFGPSGTQVVAFGKQLPDDPWTTYNPAVCMLFHTVSGGLRLLATDDLNGTGQRGFQFSENFGNPMLALLSGWQQLSNGTNLVSLSAYDSSPSGFTGLDFSGTDTSFGGDGASPLFAALLDYGEGAYLFFNRGAKQWSLVTYDGAIPGSTEHKIRFDKDIFAYSVGGLDRWGISDGLFDCSGMTNEVTLKFPAGKGFVVEEDGSGVQFSIGDTYGDQWFAPTIAFGNGLPQGFHLNLDSSSDTAASGSMIELRRQRDTTPIVADGDILGGFLFKGHDGSNLIDAAAIRAEVNGTPGTNVMPGRIKFFTNKGDASLYETLKLESWDDGGQTGTGMTIRGWNGSTDAMLQMGWDNSGAITIGKTGGPSFPHFSIWPTDRLIGLPVGDGTGVTGIYMSDDADGWFYDQDANVMNLTAPGGLQLLGAGATVTEFSTDVTLAGDSDTALPTEHVVKTYVDDGVTADLGTHTGDASIHFTEASIVHQNVSGAGTNTHADIDTHISEQTQVTKTLYVDANRGDVYTADGTISRPYKTIQAALVVATSGDLCIVAPGTYTGAVTIPSGVSIQGSGTSGTTFSGTVTTTAGGNVHLYGISFSAAVTLNTATSLIDCYFYDAVTVSGTATIQSWNTHYTPSSSGVTPITMSSSGKLQVVMSSITSQGDVPAIDQSNGMVILELCQVSGSRAANPILNSTAGIVNLLNAYVLNYGGGSAASLNNGATTTPNTINGVFAAGNVACGTAATVVEGLAFASGSLSGSALAYRPASRIANTPAGSIAATDVQAAINELDTLKPNISIGAAHPVSPVLNQLFVNNTGGPGAHTLEIWTGAAWETL